MKKFVRILLVIILCLVLVAIYFPDWFSFGYRYENAGRYTTGNCTMNEKVDTIDINWIAGEVNIVLHDGNEIKLTESAGRSLKKDEQVHWLLDDNTLYVKYMRSGRISASNMNKELTLYLPDDMSLDDVRISCVSASVEAELPEAEDVRLENVSGKTDLLLTETETLHAETVSGDMTLRFTSAPDSINAKGVSANVTVQLPENTGFTADMDSVSGRITGELLDGATETKNHTRGNGSCSIQMDTVSGNLRLDAYDR